ncbi:MAG: ABC transporter permease [Rhodocyclaceae bacterium]|nr:ABC transporter permease [Rhodocyclaceae bacterium]
MTPLRKLRRDQITALKNWRVWWHLGMADVRNRFAKSFVGPAWILLNLAMWVGGMGIIYGTLFQRPLDTYLPYLTIGFVCWGFLSQTIIDGGNAFVFAEGYIKQFTYPKQIYVLRVIVNASVPFAIGVVIFFIVTLAMGQRIGMGMLWALPGLALVLIVAYLHAFIMAYASARFRDLPHGMTALLQVLMFVTPIFFTVDTLKKSGLDFVYKYNPLYYLIELMRYPLTELKPAPVEVYVTAVLYMLIAALVALFIANRLDRRIVYIL